VDPTSEIPMIGASGAISAVLGAYLVLFPRARIQSLVFLVLFYELIAVPAIIVLGFWFLLQLMDGLVSLGLAGGTDAGIAFWAHVGGFVAGWRLSRHPTPALHPRLRRPSAEGPPPRTPHRSTSPDPGAAMRGIIPPWPATASLNSR
jgi:membrane associated rhomboid family serine protease